MTKRTDVHSIRCEDLGGEIALTSPRTGRRIVVTRAALKACSDPTLEAAPYHLPPLTSRIGEWLDGEPAGSCPISAGELRAAFAARNR